MKVKMKLSLIVIAVLAVVVTTISIVLLNKALGTQMATRLKVRNDWPPKNPGARQCQGVYYPRNRVNGISVDNREQINTLVTGAEKFKAA